LVTYVFWLVDVLIIFWDQRLIVKVTAGKYLKNLVNTISS